MDNGKMVAEKATDIINMLMEIYLMISRRMDKIRKRKLIKREVHYTR